MNKASLKGRLQILVDGHGEPVDLGEIEVPITLSFDDKPPRPDGPVYRGHPDILNVINESFPTGSVG